MGSHPTIMLFSLHRLALRVAAVSITLAISASAQQAIGELYATDASVKGSVVLANSGTTVLSGSSVQAGAQAATLKLDRGGSVLVCEGTKLSITTSQSGRELLLSLNTGNLELNYPLGAEADTLLTPDLRLMLPGPGTVHVAVRVTPQGDTCVQSLPWNVAAITISETMGDATYQVKPDEAVVFRGGHLTEASKSQHNCGCPTSAPVQVAKAAPPPSLPPQPHTAQPLASPPPTAPPVSLPVTSQGTAASASSTPPPVQHLAVEAPFVYRGGGPQPELTGNVVILKLENTRIVQLQPTVLPPPTHQKAKPKPQPTTQTAQKESHGFFAKLGAFFAGLFH
jgi:hypothetical protein